MEERRFLSHPDKLLIDHLKEVGELAEEFIKSVPLGNQSELSLTARLIGFCHDFGKYTSFFQDWLIRKKDSGRKRNHALISALLAAWVVSKEFGDPFQKESITSYLPILAFLAVHRHHGDLRDPNLILHDPDENTSEWIRDRKVLRDQIENLLDSSRLPYLESEMERLGIEGIMDFLNINTIIEIYRKLGKPSYYIDQGSLSDEFRLKLAFTAQLLFSALIDADKRDAGKVRKIGRKKIPSDIVDYYIKEKFPVPKKRLDPLRRRVYEEVTHSIETIPLEDLHGHILTLTAPTGSGKTLTALSAAIKLRNRIEKEKGYTPRIIYSLPFVNVIDQNYGVFHDVLKTLDDFERDESAYLLKHHHLSEVTYKTEDERVPLDEALMLTESWESEITVTTFVQLLHTLIGFKNSFLKKYHNLAGAILILDEIQNIPVEQWRLVGEILRGAAKYLGCTVIQMTATRPLIFSKEETIELLPDPESCFSRLDRTSIHARTSKLLPIEDFTEMILEEWDGKTSLLVVLNTIRASIETYELLKRKLKCHPVVGYPEEDEVQSEELSIVYLSTNIIPIQRRKRIEFLKERLNEEKPTILVSTQVVEAGVDLDFHRTIRDIGPLDSIVQVAGRCNRSWNREIPGQVRIINLKNGGAPWVYGKIHIWLAKELLRDRILRERDFYSAVETFFGEVRSRKDDTEYLEILKAFRHLRFDRDRDMPKVSDYRFIEKGIEIPIFVALTEEDEIICERFIHEVLEREDPIERKRAYLSIRREFKGRVITPLLERAKENLPGPLAENTQYRKIPLDKDYQDRFYDLETGFKWLPEEKAWVW